MSEAVAEFKDNSVTDMACIHLFLQVGSSRH